MREQRVIFGEVAHLYDRARAGYGDAVVEEVLGFVTHDHAGVSALEVGAGTGKATVAFASRGMEILALEPDIEMAAVARRNCRPFPNVSIEVVTFEDWAAEAHRFELLFSAQAWHWVTPEVRYRKAAEALVAGGTLALFWHRTRWSGEELRNELHDLYRRLVPELLAQEPGFPGLTPPRVDEEVPADLSASGLFHDVTVRRHRWSATFTADSFVELLVTQSNHRLLDEATRAELFGAIRQLVAAHGGTVEIPHAIFFVLAHSK